jgi:hypothetical protein
MTSTEHTSKRIWIAAGLSMLAGMLLTIHNLQGYRTTRDHAREYIGYLRQLNGVEKQMARQTLIRNQFNTLAGKSPRPLQLIVNTAEQGTDISIREQTSIPLEPGLSAQTAVLDASSLPYTTLSQLLQLAELDQPPWRLVGCTLKASSSASDSVQAKLIFEALDHNFKAKPLK